MITVERVLPATPDQVWAVLADGWLYALWVVGASHVRDVDAGWPAVGTRIHHAVGPWPLSLRDTTEVGGCEPGRSLELRARMWPVGSAQVRLDLRAEGGATRVQLGEVADSGPAAVVPESLQALLTVPRNTECLSRLSALAARRPG